MANNEPIPFYVARFRNGVTRETDWHQFWNFNLIPDELRPAMDLTGEGDDVTLIVPRVPRNPDATPEQIMQEERFVMMWTPGNNVEDVVTREHEVDLRTTSRRTAVRHYRVTVATMAQDSDSEDSMDQDDTFEWRGFQF